MRSRHLRKYAGRSLGQLRRLAPLKMDFRPRKRFRHLKKAFDLQITRYLWPELPPNREEKSLPAYAVKSPYH